MQEKYKNTQFPTQLFATLAAQYNAVLRIAYSRALELGSNAPTAELHIIASGLYGNGDYEATSRLLTIGLDNANNSNDELAALTDLAYFEARTPTSLAHKHAEELFARAQTLDVKYNLAQFPYVRSFQKTRLELAWANAIAAYDCPGAQKHFGDSMQYLRELYPGSDRDQITQEAKSAITGGIGGVQGCLPLTTTSVPQ